ncbi:MAG: SCO1664 family protein [Anaerolineae bacterium]
MNDPSEPALALSDALDLLAHGELAVRGLLPGSSNYTFLADVQNERWRGMAIYKPRQGETPLWDFPHGTLCQREMAAYLISQALGWGLVPPTAIRLGPYGQGAVQLFIAADFSQHYFTFRDEPALQPSLQRIAAFDLVINNADRKAGHTLRDEQDRVWAIDHGICFHVQPKLRTVIWEFAGLALPAQITADLAGLRAQLEQGWPLHAELASLLNEAELAALADRTEQMLEAGVFPNPDPHRRPYPWPLV